MGLIYIYIYWHLETIKIYFYIFQLLNKGASEQSYSGISDAFKTIFKNEGPTAFFKGALCRMIVIAPLFGIAQMVYYFGIAEYFMGIDKSAGSIQTTALPVAKTDSVSLDKKPN